MVCAVTNGIGDRHTFHILFKRLKNFLFPLSGNKVHILEA